MTEIEIQNLADKALEDFNCYKVRRVMKFLKWKWSVTDENGDEITRTPTEIEIYRSARRLLVEAIRDGGHSSCGGLTAYAMHCDDGTCFARITFNAEESEYDNEWDKSKEDG
ncbi:MAG: hypothetical protein LIP02_10755 [Bacteroidales bacterium]|nr:hypothetical protein [Bacteroidales bacterium]